jgi:hypothetical protein
MFLSDAATKGLVSSQTRTILDLLFRQLAKKLLVMISFEQYFDRSRGINKIALGTFSSYLFIVILHVLYFLILTAKSEINGRGWPGRWAVCTMTLSIMILSITIKNRDAQHSHTQHNATQYYKSLC